MKKLSIICLFVLFFSLLQTKKILALEKSESDSTTPRLSISDTHTNLCDNTGKLLLKIIFHFNPNDKICIKIENTLYKGYVITKEESDKHVKIIGKLFSEDSKDKETYGVGFYLDKEGRFVGTVVTQSKSKQWHFVYSKLVDGLILVEDVDVKNQESTI
jgi:hypothetical protein